MIDRVTEALHGDRITPYFQPIFDLEKKCIDQHEALVRLIQKDGLLLTPIVFLVQARQAGLYPEITKAMLKKSFEVFHDKKDKFSINLCSEDFKNESTLAYIKKTVLEHDAKEQVIFEVVESDDDKDYELTSNFVSEFKKEGYQIAIDDFGAGYLTFKHLENLPIDYLKIDGYLIKNINQDDKSKALVQEIVAFGQKSKIKVVAEHVEDEDIYLACKEMGIRYLQGYFLAKPSAEPLQSFTLP